MAGFQFYTLSFNCIEKLEIFITRQGQESQTGYMTDSFEGNVVSDLLCMNYKGFNEKYMIDSTEDGRIIIATVKDDALDENVEKVIQKIFVM